MIKAGSTRSYHWGVKGYVVTYFRQISFINYFARDKETGSFHRAEMMVLHRIQTVNAWQQNYHTASIKLLTQTNWHLWTPLCNNSPSLHNRVRNKHIPTTAPLASSGIRSRIAFAYGIMFNLWINIVRGNISVKERDLSAILLNKPIIRKSFSQKANLK
jgi:hypothetical protein